MSFKFPVSGPIEPLDDRELEASLQAQIEASTGFYGDRVGTERAELLSVYLRHGYREDINRLEQDLSTTVDSTAQDTVDQLMSELLRIFTGSDDAVSFKANSEDDVEQAQQETDTVRHVFYTMNDGYWALHNWLWDGLVQINGFVKCYWEEKQTNRVERYGGLNESELTALIMDFEADGADVEILEQRASEAENIYTVEDIQNSIALQHELLMAPEVQQSGNEVLVRSQEIDVKLRIREVTKRIRIRPVPPDEILISSRWDQVNLDECPFVGHRYIETQGELIAQNFDPEQIRMLPESEDEEFGDERTTRFDGFDLFESDDRAAVDESTRPIMITDCYAYVDRDGDGIAELVKARMGGADGQLLRYRDGSVAVEEIEETEIHSWTPFIIPHRHFGQCPVERVQDIQRNRSVMEREMMDNAVLSNNAGSVINTNLAGPDTVDDSLNFRPGRIVRVKGAPGEAIQPFKIDSTFGESIPVLEYWQDRAEHRTGATRLNQGLTGDNLSKNVPGVVIAQLQEAGMSKIDMIARNFAETGYKSLFRHIHALLRRNQDKELYFQVRGEWVDANPRDWGERSDVSIGVGIGANGKLAKIEGFQQILDKQITGLEIGVSDGTKIYNTLVDMATALGLKNGNRYFTDPATLPPQPEGSDPEADLAAAQVEVGRMDAVARLQEVKRKELADRNEEDLEDRKLAIEARKIILDDDRERDKAVLAAMVQEKGIEAQKARAQVAPPSGQGGR